MAMGAFYIVIPAMSQPLTPSPVIESATEEIAAFGQQEGMTLYDLLKAGGWVMIVLAALSVLALALVFYFMITLTQRNLVPRDRVMQIRHYLRDQRYEDIARLCRRSKGMFSKVILTGISRGAEDPLSAAAAMEAVGRREAESLMRKVRYLSDIATVSPMLGILGTVLGMIRAFNFIAFDISAVKPVALASAVAQALVTTAAGLIVAIPCMGFFFYFRGKLQSSIGEMEEIAVEISDQMVSVETHPKPSRRSKRRSLSKESQSAGSPHA
ncbi:MAG: MotA/TolQ/ExbB proton channel family protein [Candidatus Omnitrophica bacterium]|nr:MotA/TolQ/ExbB proton channel family protein [Candidatus Omnitrophota bacterium]